MDWVADHVQSVSSAAFSIKWPFPLELPIGPRHGLVGKQKVEDMRTKLHAFVVENDLRPIWFFEILFHSWAGLQVPAAHFRVPLARHGFDIAMYLLFLVIWTFAVVLDYGNAAELTTSQLASSKEMCGTLHCSTVFYMRLWCWLYIVGSLEKELRQLVRLREVCKCKDILSLSSDLPAGLSDILAHRLQRYLELDRSLEPRHCTRRADLAGAGPPEQRSAASGHLGSLAVVATVANSARAAVDRPADPRHL